MLLIDKYHAPSITLHSMPEVLFIPCPGNDPGILLLSLSYRGKVRVRQPKKCVQTSVCLAELKPVCTLPCGGQRRNVDTDRLELQVNRSQNKAASGSPLPQAISRWLLFSTHLWRQIVCLERIELVSLGRGSWDDK